MECIEDLDRLVAVQRSLAAIHPALVELQPVAVVEGDQFLIYEATPEAGYHFTGAAPTPMPIPAGVRAAFPLDALAGRPACIVTADVFDEPAGIVTMLHEFVHCYQFNTCEMKLKESLAIARQAQEEGNFTWELDYPFPYQDSAIEAAYCKVLNSEADILTARTELYGLLASGDLEYLRWQEWKEGFARYLENQMKRQLGLAVNRNGYEPPFDRVSFYAGGAAWIAYLVDQEADVVEDLEGLFEKMFTAVHR